MKVPACPQCGAIIKNISERQKIVECDYCRSKILLSKEFFYDVSDKEVKSKKQKNKHIVKKGNVTVWNSPYSGIPKNPKKNRINEPEIPADESSNKVAVFLIIAFGTIFIAAMLLAMSDRADKRNALETKPKYKSSISF